jgi:hypothetical protein
MPTVFFIGTQQYQNLDQFYAFKFETKDLNFFLRM